MNGKMTSQKADMILFLLSIIWGSGYTVTKVAVELTSPIQFLTYRFLLASLLAFVFFRKRFAKAEKQDWLAGSLIGFFLSVAILLLTTGLQYTTAGKAVFLSSAFVLLVPFLEWFFTKSRPEKKVLFAIPVMVLGLGILTFEKGEFGVFQMGDILILLSAIAFALHTTVIGLYAPKRDPLLLSGIQFVVSGALFTVFSLFDQNRQPLSIEAVWAILYSGVIITFLCFVVQVYCQRFTSASHAALLINLESVFGSIIAVVFLKERYTLTTIFAFLLIFASVLIVELKKRTGRSE